MLKSNTTISTRRKINPELLHEKSEDYIESDENFSLSEISKRIGIEEKPNGKTPTTRILSEDEYIKELCKKTQEELTEYIEAKTKPDKLEELSDLLELINALAEHEGATLEEINNIRKKKAEERGGFSDRVFLIEVTDN